MKQWDSHSWWNFSCVNYYSDLYLLTLLIPFAMLCRFWWENNFIECFKGSFYCLSQGCQTSGLWSHLIQPVGCWTNCMPCIHYMWDPGWIWHQESVWSIACSPRPGPVYAAHDVWGWISHVHCAGCLQHVGGTQHHGSYTGCGPGLAFEAGWTWHLWPKQNGSFGLLHYYGL